VLQQLQGGRNDEVLLDHEHVVLTSGRRSGIAIVVAVHSTRLGPALGGCRVWNYDGYVSGLRDALRLSSAMTLKCAVADLPTGGGKSVLALEPGVVLEGRQRRDALLDLGDVVEGLGGSYRTAEDVGTSGDDMVVVRERTAHVLGLPAANGGAGEPAEPTAEGVWSALLSTVARLDGGGVAGRRFAVQGLGQVGSRVARRLANEGAELVVTDVDPARQRLSDALGARWVRPEALLDEAVDVLVPAGVGGVLSSHSIPRLRCRAVVGPANNQLASFQDAELLAERGILWAPDFVVNAGGALFAILADGDTRSDELRTRIEGIGMTLTRLYEQADLHSTTPLAAARSLAARRLARAPEQTVPVAMPEGRFSGPAAP
jgi:leucine dehydrogenase